jgi:MFS family permease
LFGGYAIDQWGTVFTGLISGIAAGLGVGYMSTKFREYLWEPYDEHGWLDVGGWLRGLGELTYGAVVGALSGAMAGTGFGLALALVAASPSPDRLDAAFVTGLAATCAGGLISGAGLAVILRLLSDLVEQRQILDTLWVLASLSIGVFAGLVFGLAIGVGREGLSGSADNGAAGDWWWFPFGVGASVGVITGLAAHRAVSRAGREPQRIRAYWWRRPITLRGMATGLVVGAGFGITIGLPGDLIAGLAFGAPVGLATMLAASLIQTGTSEHRIAAPRDTWRQDLNAAIIGGLTTGLAFGLLGGLGLGLRFGATSGVLAGLSVGLGTALLFGLTASLGAAAATALGTAVLLPTVLSQSLLAIRHRTPWRMLRFLEDARSRNLVRTVGPDYQFRHAKLQDRLARQWLLTAAEEGDISAMVNLGFLAVHVDPPQLEEARYWFNRAVDAGYSEARTYLSEIDDDLAAATDGKGYHESEDSS